MLDIDGRVIGSLFRVVFRPGSLTNSYLKGQRLPFIGPLQIFLLANVIFFASQSITNTNIFSTTLHSHIEEQDWSPLAKSLSEKRVAKLGLSMEEYAPKFDEAVGRHAKSLILILVLPFAAVLALVLRSTRRSFFSHLVFAFHIYAFLLLLFSFASYLGAVNVYFGGEGLHSKRVDLLLTLLNLLLTTVYFSFALRAVYRLEKWELLLKALALTAGVSCLFMAYRFSLFLITLYTT